MLTSIELRGAGADLRDFGDTFMANGERALEWRRSTNDRRIEIAGCGCDRAYDGVLRVLDPRLRGFAPFKLARCQKNEFAHGSGLGGQRGLRFLRVTARPPMPQPPSGTSSIRTRVAARTAGMPSASTTASVTLAIMADFLSASSAPAGTWMVTTGMRSSGVTMAIAILW
jgi:hypothetical protein